MFSNTGSGPRFPFHALATVHAKLSEWTQAAFHDTTHFWLSHNARQDVKIMEMPTKFSCMNRHRQIRQHSRWCEIHSAYKES